MSVSIRDLNQRVDALTPPQFDVAHLLRRGEERRRRRRAGAVIAATAAVVAVVAGGVLLAQPGHRDAAPPPPGPDRKNHPPDVVESRQVHRRLTYAVGSTIHWGDRTIDVERQTNRWPRWGRLVDFVDATDDGAVFVIGQPPSGTFRDVTIPNGPAAVWFTDGSAPVRIGTTIGDRPRGFEIAPTAEGSTLAWTDPGSTTQPGQIVVYDTARMSEVAQFGHADAEPLAVYPDVVYWSPAGTDCDAYASRWGRSACQGTGPVMRFDLASGEQSPISRADYLADRRARPGLLIGRHDHGQSSLFLDLVRRGDGLLAEGQDPGGASTPIIAMTGQPLRLRLPAGNGNPDGLTLTQWLDADRVVLVGTDAHDGNDLVVCRLSTGRCHVAARIPDANPSFTAPGPAVSHG